MRTTLMRWTANIAEFGARRSTAILLLILLASGLFSALHAVVKPFWYDEICTVIMSRLANESEIWKALDDAADTNPPLYYSVTRVARQLIPDDHLGYRLPSILGLLGIVAGLYLFLCRRVNQLAALVGASFVLCTPLASYAFEARPYALMVGCISGAILAWQRIDDSRLYPVVLAITLAAAVSLHYYAILVWPAFVLAEASLWLFGRRFRVGAWAAIFTGAVPLLFFAGLLGNLRQYYGQNFWAQPSAAQALSAYDWLFSVDGYWGWTFTAGLTAIFAYWSLINTSKAAARRSPENRNGPDQRDRALPIEECVLILVLLWLPVISVAAAKASHGGMISRYMMPTVLGGALAVGYLASKAPIEARGLLLVLMLMNYGLSSVSDVKKILEGTLLEQRATAAGEVKVILTRHSESDLPVVISSGLRYLPMAYYVPAGASSRLYAVTEPGEALKFAGTDSVDLALLVLRRYFPLQVEDYGDFASRHREFILVSGSGQWFDWWPARLSHDGHTVSLLEGGGDTKIYKVTLRP
jgi:hypothetical protein